MQSHKQPHLNRPAGSQAVRIYDTVRSGRPPEPPCFCVPRTALLFLCITVPYSAQWRNTRANGQENQLPAVSTGTWVAASGVTIGSIFHRGHTKCNEASRNSAPKQWGWGRAESGVGIRRAEFGASSAQLLMPVSVPGGGTCPGPQGKVCTKGVFYGQPSDTFPWWSASRAPGNSLYKHLILRRTHTKSLNLILLLPFFSPTLTTV